MGYPAWPAGRACIFSLQFWLTWHAAKPRTAQLYFHFTVVAIWYLISVINMAILIFWICTLQDSVPAGSYNDPFLSSVIPMVTPTWCHRANWGNPVWGECRLTWIPNLHIFNLVIRLSKVQQLALPLCTFSQSLGRSGCPRVPRQRSSSTLQPCRTSRNLLFSQ